LPADFLLPLFAVTLVANAILVAFAIRAMRRGQPDSDRPNWTARPPTSGQSGPAAATRTEPTPAEQVTMKTPGPAEPAGHPESGPQAAAAGSSAPRPARKPAAKPVPTPSPKRRSSKAAADAPASKPRPAEPRRGRRRFSLPPLDDDHEKVNRSIESFLGGIDGSGTGPGAAEPATTGVPTEPESGPTTVALIAVDGLATDPGTVATVDHPDDDAVNEALAMVERTLRGAARGTDIVTARRRGRFQIILTATGELATRAYLRRIRAAIEPRLEAVDRPLRLAVATATVLDEPLHEAVRRAEDRLQLAIDAARASDRAARQATTEGEPDSGPGDEQRAPRAAAD
jgi:hypothetical protein